MEDKLVSMLRQQRELQEKLGYHFERMNQVARIRFIKDMHIAAIAELNEALDETSWKPWANTLPFINKIAFMSELGDAFQFIMNMWFAAFPDADADDLATMMLTTLETKLPVNLARHRNGYDGVSTKCHQCKRALDDPAVACTRTSDQGWCETYQVDINYLETRDTVAS